MANETMASPLPLTPKRAEEDEEEGECMFDVLCAQLLTGVVELVASSLLRCLLDRAGSDGDGNGEGGEDADAPVGVGGARLS